MKWGVGGCCDFLFAKSYVYIAEIAFNGILVTIFLNLILAAFFVVLELRCSVVQHRSRSNNYEIVLLFHFGHFKFHFSKRFQVFIVC